MAILQTRCDKGSLQMRRLVLFWNWQILWRATAPGQYLWGFFTFLALRNSFWGALPPMVGWNFLLASSSPLDVDGQAYAAIWANCWVGNDLVTSTHPPTSLHPPFSSPSHLGLEGASTPGTGGSTSAGGSTGAACTSAHVFISRAFLPTPSRASFCPYHTRIKRKPANQTPEQLHKNHLTFVLN